MVAIWVFGGVYGTWVRVVDVEGPFFCGRGTGAPTPWFLSRRPLFFLLSVAPWGGAWNWLAGVEACGDGGEEANEEEAED